MKKLLRSILVISVCTFSHSLRGSGIPVVDAANLANNTTNHLMTLAKWVENIAQLKQQISHLKEQIAIQDELRNWAGDPKKAAQSLALDILRERDLARDYGQARDALRRAARSLDTLERDDAGTFFTVDIPDIDGGAVTHDPQLYRRYSLLDAQQDNTRRVIDATRVRERELLEEIALTLGELRSATTDAEVQKLSAKLSVLNGQLTQVENARRREVDEIFLQRTANDARREVEQIAGEETQARDDFLASRRVTAFMQNMNPYKRKN